jgi:hypothetical protein
MENLIFELPKDKIAFPALYAPPLASLPEEDTPESAKIMADRARYEASLASSKEGRQQYENAIKENEKAFNISLEEERTGIDIPEDYGQGAPIQGSSSIDQEPMQEVIQPPPEDMFSKMEEVTPPKQEKPASPHIKEVDGRKLISKKFLDDNREAFNSISKGLGFTDSKELIKRLLN